MVYFYNRPVVLGLFGLYGLLILIVINRSSRKEDAPSAPAADVGVGYSARQEPLAASAPAKSLDWLSYHFNLLDGTGDWQTKMTADSAACTLEYINGNKLAQDHPCVIDIIRRHFLQAPSPSNVPYNMTSSTGPNDDPSPGQVPIILRFLKNQTGGFFFDCGAFDGDWISNSLYMERTLKWTGVLVEANPDTFMKLRSKNRKSWKMPACLSLKPYPTVVEYKAADDLNAPISHIVAAGSSQKRADYMNSTFVQCFPVYSILLAIGQTRVDFFSLDVEGHELLVLKTIPLHKVDIRSITIEWENLVGGKQPLIDWMEDNGFLLVGETKKEVAMDVIFIKDTLNDESRRTKRLF